MHEHEVFSFAQPERDRCHSGKPGWWIMFALPSLFASLFMKMFSLVDFSHKCIALHLSCFVVN